MKWETWVLTDDSVAGGIEQGMADAAQYFSRRFSGTQPHLALLFFSGYAREEVTALSRLIPTCLKPQHWIGCSCGGVVGQGMELERKKAVSITLAHLPDVILHPFHIVPRAFADARGVVDALGLPHGAISGATPHFILLSDPFTFNTENFLEVLDDEFPDGIKVGGHVSGGQKGGDHFLLVDDGIYQSGLAGVCLAGAIRIDTIVSPGCRPIGQPYFVTASRKHLILSLDNQNPIDVLRQIFNELSEPDQELFQHALTLGIAVTPEGNTLQQGDFLIRRIKGGEPENGHLAINGHLHPYQAVQFHLRDPLAAHLELETLIDRHVFNFKDRPFPAGALMFTCLGRGRDFFGLSHHDARIFQEKLGSVPMGGFFCNGEIGPIHGKTCLHGFTSVLCLFTAPSRQA
ncbi:MAG: FIST C-terminal domain-containing protein [Magnetococcales bacterium]|nr:FIST C-terminal domain-containing protein [Magnetococcales bacterium]